MKVTIDQELCVGNGICEALAPEVFETTAEGTARLLTDTVSDDQRDEVAEAVASCPMQALAVDDA